MKNRTFGPLTEQAIEHSYDHAVEYRKTCALCYLKANINIQNNINKLTS